MIYFNFKLELGNLNGLIFIVTKNESTYCEIGVLEWGWFHLALLTSGLLNQPISWAEVIGYSYLSFGVCWFSNIILLILSLTKASEIGSLFNFHSLFDCLFIVSWLVNGRSGATNCGFSA